jgi:hypothetical protein
VFLSHARLYTLGDKYDIASLKRLALHRLHATLKEFELYASRLVDVITLGKYVYENTVANDKIREMITLYFACVIEDAIKCDAMNSFMEEAPDFAFSLVQKMTERFE